MTNLDKIFNVVLDLSNESKSKIPAITFNKNDRNTSIIAIKITNDGFAVDLSNKDIDIFILKPDNTKVFNNMKIVDAIQGIIFIELPTQSLAAAGNCSVELRIQQDNEIRIPATFNYTVLDSIIDDKAIESTNEFSALTEKINEVNKLIETGIEGLEGPQGPPGDKGDSFTYEDFTEEQLALLVGPQGPKGETGPKGEQGPAGSQGIQGQTGKDGAAGPQGPMGEQGPAGIQGERGLQGATGNSGAIGPKGDPGITGTQGPAGINGKDGKSIEYNWNGTELGIKKEGETSYNYVDLRGPQGPIGPGGGGSGGSSLTANLLKAYENKLALNSNADGSGTDLYIGNRDNSFTFYGKNNQSIGKIRQNGSDARGYLCLDGLVDCLASPLISYAQNSNAIPILTNGMPSWVKTTSSEWSEPTPELFSPGTYCINAADEMWYMGANYQRKKLVSSDYAALKLFKEDPENDPVTLDEKEVTERELFPSLKYLSDQFKADIEGYIQYKIDTALINLK